MPLEPGPSATMLGAGVTDADGGESNGPAPAAGGVVKPGVTDAAGGAGGLVGPAGGGVAKAGAGAPVVGTPGAVIGAETLGASVGALTEGSAPAESPVVRVNGVPSAWTAPRLAAGAGAAARGAERLNASRETTATSSKEATVVARRR
jgi:hypothetical protein